MSDNRKIRIVVLPQKTEWLRGFIAGVLFAWGLSITVQFVINHFFP